MVEIEIYAPGLRQDVALVALEGELANWPALRHKVDLNHDLVYFEIDDPGSISLNQIFLNFQRAGLEPRLVGERPQELPEQKAGDTVNLNN